MSFDPGRRFQMAAPTLAPATEIAMARRTDGTTSQGPLEVSITDTARAGRTMTTKVATTACGRKRFVELRAEGIVHVIGAGLARHGSNRTDAAR